MKLSSFAAAIIFAVSLAADHVRAGDTGHTYRTIAPQAARSVRGATRYESRVEPLPAKPYAYGWFGVAPRSYGGFYRDYYNGLRATSRSGR